MSNLTTWVGNEKPVKPEGSGSKKNGEIQINRPCFDARKYESLLRLGFSRSRDNAGPDGERVKK